jgi:hypothetical protein
MTRLLTADASKVTRSEFLDRTAREFGLPFKSEAECKADAEWLAEYTDARDAGDSRKCGKMLRAAALASVGIVEEDIPPARYVMTERARLGKAA